MREKDIDKLVGKQKIFSDKNELNGKLIYISGINGFDNVLGNKDQKEIKALIHLKEMPKGLILSLVKNFEINDTAISFKAIKSTSISKYKAYSIVQIDLDNCVIYFGYDNWQENEVLKFFKSISDLKLSLDDKISVPDSIIKRFESYLVKHTDILPFNVESVITPKSKRLFGHVIDYSIISLVSLYFISSFGLIERSEKLILIIGIYLTYYLILEGFFQRTIGKLILKTKVVGIDGARTTNILSRTILRILPFEPLSFFFNETGWHDSLSETTVIDSVK